MSTAAIGAAWQAAAAELQRELRALDPEAAVAPALTASGLLALEVEIAPAHRRQARLLAREHANRANAICEDCGGEAPAVQAGAVIEVRCQGCRD